MSFQWMAQASTCPIVEFHEVRTDRFASDRYLDLVGGELRTPLTASGVVPMGEFRVAGQPDRLVLLRGFSSMLARRDALTRFHAGREWAAQRQAVADLVRTNDVFLTRAITPEEGPRPLRLAGPLLVLRSETRFAEQIGNYHLWLRLLLRKAGLNPLAAFATLEAVNDVPAVPVVHHRTFHMLVLPGGSLLPELPRELRNMLRFAPEKMELEPVFSLVA